MGMNAKISVLPVNKANHISQLVDLPINFETITTANQVQFSVESVIQDSIGIHQDILCGSVRPIKEIGSRPPVKGSSVAKEIVAIAPCLLYRIAQKSVRQDLGRGVQNPTTAL